MADLIDRQAAIDALMELVEARHEWKSDASGEINGLNAAYCAIEDLPSAQPDVSDINVGDMISRQQAISRAVELRMFDRPVKMVAVSELERLPSAQPEPEELDFVQPHKKIDVRLEIGQPDRSLWFRIGEICVDESNGFITAGRAVEKIRELLREAERREE